MLSVNASYAKCNSRATGENSSGLRPYYDLLWLCRQSLCKISPLSVTCIVDNKVMPGLSVVNYVAKLRSRHDAC